MKRARSSSSSLPRSDKPNVSDKFERRLLRLWRELEIRGVDGLLLTHTPNLLYLFNIQPSAGYALCCDGRCHLIVDGRYIEQAQANAVNCVPVKAEKSLDDSLRNFLSQAPSRPSGSVRLGVEGRHLPLATADLISGWRTGCRLVPLENVVETLRCRKDTSEIEALERSFQIAREAFQVVVENLHPGMTELEVAGVFELELRRRGAEKAAFDTIVASGSRSSMPHARASRRTIGRSDLVLVDFGVQNEGYCSDLTRIHLFPGKRPPRILNVVREAQLKALEVIRPGVLSSQVDAAAREHISSRGYGDYFTHSLGHGLGLEVHEAPLISWRAPQRLEEGMVFTVEPGVYLPGRHGVRIEDAVVVTRDGCRILPAP